MTSRSHTSLQRIPFTALGVAAGIVAAAALLGACSTPARPGAQPPEGIPAPGEVLGQGTVIQIGDSAPQFCLGPVAESYPPQCSGPEIAGWDWSGVQGAETSDGVTWGGYAVQGTWDGTHFTVTSPPMWLALYDPIRIVDPRREPENAGTSPEQRLLAIQNELATVGALRPLTSWIENGYLFATYVYDDGDIQRHLDTAYGADVVQVRPALRDANP
ncbi:MAG TPA: hypothetical protein PJ998_02120 [Terrimesophilobacter sp.]|nr:hypothetical protein [Terrimesophilobacter sp.]